MRNSMASVGMTLALMWIGHFLVDVMIGFWSVYKTISGVDLAIAGLIAGICPFIGEGMQLLFGSIGDRGYRKPLFLFGVATAGASALLPLYQSYFYFFLLFLLTCIGSGAFHPTAVAITSGLTQNRKGLFITIFASGGALGLALSHMIFSVWYLHFRLPTAWLMLPAFVLVFYAATKTMPGALHKPTQAGRRYGLKALKKLFAYRDLRVLYLSQVCIQSIYWGTMFLLPDVLTSKGYPTWMCFGAGHFVYIIGGAFMMIPGGYLSDRFSARSVLLISNMAGCVIFYLFLLTPNLPLPSALVLLAMMGASLGTANPVAVALGNRIMPSRPGLVSAFLMGMVWCVAEWLGPGGGGLLTKLFSENAPTFALSTLGLLFCVGTAMTALLPRSVDKEFELDLA